VTSDSCFATAALSTLAVVVNGKGCCYRRGKAIPHPAPLLHPKSEPGSCGRDRTFKLCRGGAYFQMSQQKNAFDSMTRDDLLRALKMFAKNWLAHDGCWFLARKSTCYGSSDWS
jgi:hypothetical protein